MLGIAVPGIANSVGKLPVLLAGDAAPSWDRWTATSYPLGRQIWFGPDDINDAFSSGDIALRVFEGTVAPGTPHSYSRNVHS